MRLAVDGLVLEADAWGPPDGPPVLLLHGFPEGRGCWSRLAPRLADAGLRVVAPDQRGYSPGARPPDVAAYALDRLVADAAEVLDRLGWTDAHVVGHDWGAAVGWALAATRPERVRTLTAVSVPHPAAFAAALRSRPDQMARSAYVGLFRMEGRAERVLLADDGRRLRAMVAGPWLDDAGVDALVAPLLEPGALTAALAWYRATGTADLAAVPPVEVPTTYLWGPQDVAVSRAAAVGAASFARGEYRFVELPGVGHWVPEQAPDRLAAEVLARVSGRP